MRRLHQKSLVFSAALGVLVTAGIAVGAPRITIPETTFNFGYVPQNSKISHEYWLHSTGDDSLRITKVIPGCGCTKAPLEKEVLAPGDSTRLEVIFNSGSYTGNVTKRPMIETNEGPPQKYIQFYTNVVARPDSTKPIVIKPYKLDISQFGELTREKMTFSITNVSDQPLDITLVSWPAEYADIVVPKSVGPGQTVEGVLTLKPAALDKEFEKSVTIELTDDGRSRFTIPIKRGLRGPGQPTEGSPATSQTGPKSGK